MKFYGNLNELINTRKKDRFNGTSKLVPLFRFDSNGEFETEDIKLIEKLKPHFKYESENTQNDENASVETPMLKCKKCNFETDNKGILMSHYRDHKKEGK